MIEAPCKIDNTVGRYNDGTAIEPLIKNAHRKCSGIFSRHVLELTDRAHFGNLAKQPILVTDRVLPNVDDSYLEDKDWCTFIEKVWGKEEDDLDITVYPDTIPFSGMLVWTPYHTKFAKTSTPILTVVSTHEDGNITFLTAIYGLRYKSVKGNVVSATIFTPRKTDDGMKLDNGSCGYIFENDKIEAKFFAEGLGDGLKLPTIALCNSMAIAVMAYLQYAIDNSFYACEGQPKSKGVTKQTPFSDESKAGSHYFYINKLPSETVKRNQCTTPDDDSEIVLARRAHRRTLRHERYKNHPYYLVPKAVAVRAVWRGDKISEDDNYYYTAKLE